MNPPPGGSQEINLTTTTLCRYADNGNLREIKSIVGQCKAEDVNSLDRKGFSPLFFAAQGGFLDVVLEFLNFPGIDLNKKVILPVIFRLIFLVPGH